jgi:SAM-dependent methyltransferase
MSENNFADLYLKARKKEKRIYPDEEVSMLPFVKRDHLHFGEWETRKKSFKKFRSFLRQKNKSLRILDIGCGNGWMSNLLSEINNSTVIGIDRNNFETEQARRVFKDNPHVYFFCDDILETQQIGTELFDVIVMAASVQYFPDFKILIDRLLNRLKQDGEIHIIDSQFYDDDNISKAKNSTHHYYEELGFPGMANYYYHHRWSDVIMFNFEIMNRSFLQRLLLKIFKTKENYFPWVVIRKR